MFLTLIYKLILNTYLENDGWKNMLEEFDNKKIKIKNILDDLLKK